MKNSPEMPRGPYPGVRTCEENNTSPVCPWGTNSVDTTDPEVPSRNPGILLAT